MSATAELYQQQGYDFMAAVFEVHTEMGHGFLEEVYHESVELELTERRIPFTSKPKLTLSYKGRLLKKQYEADLIVIGEIVVELKAVKALAPRARGPAHQLSSRHPQAGWLPHQLRGVSETRMEAFRPLN